MFHVVTPNQYSNVSLRFTKKRFCIFLLKKRWWITPISQTKIIKIGNEMRMLLIHSNWKCSKCEYFYQILTANKWSNFLNEPQNCAVIALSIANIKLESIHKSNKVSLLKHVWPGWKCSSNNETNISVSIEGVENILKNKPHSFEMTKRFSRNKYVTENLISHCVCVSHFQSLWERKVEMRCSYLVFGCFFSRCMCVQESENI